jgi:hypothetical protein
MPRQSPHELVSMEARQTENLGELSQDARRCIQRPVDPEPPAVAEAAQEDQRIAGQ